MKAGLRHRRALLPFCYRLATSPAISSAPLRLLARSLSLVFVAAACGGGAATPSLDPLAGVYRIGGGDAAIANVTALADAFMARHPGVKFQYDTTLGSDGGVNLAADQTLDLGMASRELTAVESGRVDRVLVGVAGTGLVVHQGNGLRDLTTAQVQAIYSGKITDWAALGQTKLPMIPLVREKGSSARATFETYFFAGKPTYGPGVLEIQGGDQIRQAVAGQPGAIGTVGVTGDDPVEPGFRLVTIDGVFPSKQTLRDGTYKLRRPLYLVYSRGGEQKPAISEFINFIRGAEGQKIIDRL
jgi:phosphate transport system substrate-binding protein